jgi:hypothetical protein
MAVEMPSMRTGLPRWARVAAAPAVTVIFLLGLWFFGGVITDDFDVAMALTALWFAAFGAGALAVAWRRTDLRIPVGGAFLVTATVVGGFLAFSTLRDKTVDERVVTGAPTGSETSSEPGEAPAAGNGNVTVASGNFRGIAHETVGKAAVVKLEGSERKLTLTGFQTDPGPDLFVYLVSGGSADDTDDHKNLGSLNGNKGNQQYAIPPGVDIRAYNTVVIWCRAFSVAFGAAELSAV